MAEPAYQIDALPDRNSRGAYAIYCDDIRLEVSGKNTYVGVYSDLLLVKELPALIPQLCIAVHAWTTHDRPFKKLVFRVLQGDEVLNEDAFNTEAASEKWAAQRAKLGDLEPIDPSARMKVSRIIRISPFLIENEGALRVRIETEDGELRAGGLSLRAGVRTDQGEPAPPPGGISGGTEQSG